MATPTLYAGRLKAAIISELDIYGQQAAALAEAWAESDTSPDGTDSKSSKSWAETSAISAAAAAASEAAAGPLYPNTAAGLAATSIGQWFTVNNGDGTFTVWLHDTGDVATNGRSLVTTAYADTIKIVPVMTGVGVETTALQNALDSSNVAGKRVVEVTEGVFSVGSVTLKNGTILTGRGRDKTTLKLGAATNQGLLRCITGEGDITISDLTIDGNNLGAASLGYLVVMNHVLSGIRFERVRFKNWSDRAVVQIYVDAPIQGISFIDCEFVDCSGGGIAIGLNSAAAKGVSDIKIIGNLWDRCGGGLCHLIDYSSVPTTTLDRRGAFIDVKYNFNVVRNCVGFGVGNGPIPTELWGCEGLEQIGNLIESGTRGLSASAYNQDVLISHNVIKNQTNYAMEAGPSRNVKVCNNIVINCNTFFRDTTGSTGKDSSGANIPIKARMANVEICNNLVMGTGIASYNSSNPADNISIGNDGSGLPSGVSIHDNIFINIENARSVMRLSGQSSYPIFAGVTGVGAQFTYTLKGLKGQVEVKGAGYTSAPALTIVPRDGNGTGMTATVTIDALGRLDIVTVTAPGSGYTSAPQVVITGDGREGEIDLLMAIDTVSIVNGGSGYTAGAFSISGNGSCTNAAGTYTVTSGVIDSVTLTSGGEGFGRPSDFFIYNNTYRARTYTSTIQFVGLVMGSNLLSRGNRWQRSANFDTSHPNGGSTLDVYQYFGPTIPQGDPQVVSEGDSAEMTGINSTTRLSAIGSGNSTARYGMVVRGFRARGNMSDGCFRFNDPSGTTVLEDFDIRDLNISGTNLNSNVNAACMLGLASGEYLIKAGAYVNLGAAKKKGRRLRLHYEGGTATRQVKVRHDRTTGGQTQALIKTGYVVTTTNSTPVLGEVTLGYGNVSSAAVAPGSYQVGGTATVASTGTPVETTITLPAGSNNTWLCTIDVEIAGDGTVKSFADFSVQVG